MTDRTQPPEVKILERIPFMVPEQVFLGNGLPVYIIRAGTQDISKVEIVFRAGSWYQSKPLSAKFTSKMLLEGTQSFTSRQIAEEIDFFGAHLETNSNKDLAQVSLFTLNRYFDKTISLMAEVTRNPVFPDEELEVLRQNQKQKFIINQEKVRHVARKRFNHAIFGKNHPYGTLTELVHYDQICNKDLIDFHRSHYNLSEAFIIMAGRIGDDHLERLDRFFGREDRTSYKHPGKTIPDLPENNKNRTINIRKPDSLQSAIRIGRLLFNKSHPDYQKVVLVSTILGGYFDSRLMTTIREEKGYTYGIGSAVVSLQQSGYFFIASEVGSDVTRHAIRDIYSEMGRLTEELVTPSELRLVRNYMMGSLIRSMDGPFDISETVKGLVQYGLDTSYLTRFMETINSITPEEIRDMAQTYLDPGKMTELTVGDYEKA
ncbi:MAG: insulinase family protein [Bacteroidales bacterium]|nr:insulinase family protein [Bacteroidales bacterium]